MGVVSGMHPLYGKIFIVDLLSTEASKIVDIKKYKIDKSLWPENYVSLRKICEKEESGENVLVTLKYIFLLDDNT